jgi:hypothetical protein
MTGRGGWRPRGKELLVFLPEFLVMGKACVTTSKSPGPVCAHGHGVRKERGQGQRDSQERGHTSEETVFVHLRLSDTASPTAPDTSASTRGHR